MFWPQVGRGPAVRPQPAPDLTDERSSKHAEIYIYLQTLLRRIKAISSLSMPLIIYWRQYCLMLLAENEASAAFLKRK
jgi:hypothetical protein